MELLESEVREGKKDDEDEGLLAMTLVSLGTLREKAQTNTGRFFRRG